MVGAWHRQRAGVAEEIAAARADIRQPQVVHNRAGQDRRLRRIGGAVRASACNIEVVVELDAGVADACLRKGERRAVVLPGQGAVAIDQGTEDLAAIDRRVRLQLPTNQEQHIAAGVARRRFDVAGHRRGIPYAHGIWVCDRDGGQRVPALSAGGAGLDEPTIRGDLGIKDLVRRCLHHVEPLQIAQLAAEQVDERFPAYGVAQRRGRFDPNPAEQRVDVGDTGAGSPAVGGWRVRDVDMAIHDPGDVHGVAGDGIGCAGWPGLAADDIDIAAVGAGLHGGHADLGARRGRRSQSFAIGDLDGRQVGLIGPD